MFYFRINKVKIISNREKGFLFFNKDRAEVKLFSFVTTDNTDLSELASLDYSSSEDERRFIINETVKRCVSTRTFVEIPHVKDNQTLLFGDSGYVLYQSAAIPNDFNWVFLVIESDKGARDFGMFLDETVKSDNFDRFGKNILSQLTGQLPVNLVKQAGDMFVTYLADVLKERLKKSKDDVIGIVYASWNRKEHYPDGQRKKDNMHDLTKNMIVDYSIYVNEEDPGDL